MSESYGGVKVEAGSRPTERGGQRTRHKAKQLRLWETAPEEETVLKLFDDDDLMDAV
jgi:hypothetical protein